MDKKIDPKQVIKELSVEELCQSAEEFFQSTLHNPTHAMARPAADILDAPQMFYRIGLVLAGLRLGKSMEVLDFGSGACWFSRFLNQMQCVTISVDVSKTALELGKRLFEISPIVGEYLYPPRFVHFDGRRIELDDETVDRIVCFDSFHHVPNQRQVLEEFFRVLKPGGIVGFSEPGMHHSQTQRSQTEMREFSVLENDIRLDEIKEIATEIGFSEPRVTLMSNPDLELDYNTYEKIVKWPITPDSRRKLITQPRRSLRALFRRKDDSALPIKIFEHIVPVMQNSAVFFLTKGTYSPDSRSPIGLKHKIKLPTGILTAQVGAPMELKVYLENVGSSKWLHRSDFQDIGVVRIGVHLLDTNLQLLKTYFACGELEADVMPGQAVTGEISITFTEPGEYILSFDLVSEHVCWFSAFSSQPQHLRVNVT